MDDENGDKNDTMDPKSIIQSFINDIGKCISKIKSSDDENIDGTESETKENDNIDKNSLIEIIDKFTKHIDSFKATNTKILNEYYTIPLSETCSSSFTTLRIFHEYFYETGQIQCNLIGALLLLLYHHAYLNEHGDPIDFDLGENYISDIKDTKNEELQKLYIQRKEECMKCLDLLDLLLGYGVNPSLDPLPIKLTDYGGADYNQRNLKMISIYDDWKKDITDTDNIVSNEPYDMKSSEGEYSYGFRTIYHLSQSMKKYVYHQVKTRSTSTS